VGGKPAQRREGRFSFGLDGCKGGRFHPVGIALGVGAVVLVIPGVVTTFTGGHILGFVLIVVGFGVGLWAGTSYTGHRNGHA